MTDEKQKVDGIKIGQVIAGSLASITAAVVGSTMGVEGTLVGAGLASVVSTIGSTVYLRSIHHTKRGVQTVRDKVVTRAGYVKVTIGNGELIESTESTDAPTVRLPRTAARRRPMWQVIVAGSALVFVLGMALVTGIEWLKGAPLSGGQGTTFGQIVHVDHQTDRGPGFLPSQITSRPATSPTNEPTDSTTSAPTTSTSSPRTSSATPTTTTPVETGSSEDQLPSQPVPTSAQPPTDLEPPPTSR